MSKGSVARPFGVDQDTYAANRAAIFPKEEDKTTGDATGSPQEQGNGKATEVQHGR